MRLHTSALARPLAAPLILAACLAWLPGAASAQFGLDAMADLPPRPVQDTEGIPPEAEEALMLEYSDPTLVNGAIHALRELRRAPVTVRGRLGPAQAYVHAMVALHDRHRFRRTHILPDTDRLEIFRRSAWLGGWIVALSELARSEPVWGGGETGELAPLGWRPRPMIVQGPRWADRGPGEGTVQPPPPAPRADEFHAWGESMMEAAELVATGVEDRLRGLMRAGYQHELMTRELVSGERFEAAHATGEDLLLNHVSQPSLTALRAYQAILRPYFRQGAYGYFGEGARALDRYRRFEGRCEEIFARARSLLLVGPAEAPDLHRVLPAQVEYLSREDYLAGAHIPEDSRYLFIEGAPRP